MKKPFKTNWAARIGLLLAILYSVYATSVLHISWAHFVAGLGNGMEFLTDMVPPNFERWKLLVSNLYETVYYDILAATLISITALIMVGEYLAVQTKDAGGIGVALESALNLFRWNEIALILLLIFAVVIVAEIFVTKIRQRII
ncbi:MAG: hypothetical protein ACLFQR_06820 [Desulfovibrionales bacterium]